MSWAHNQSEEMAGEWRNDQTQHRQRSVRVGKINETVKFREGVYQHQSVQEHHVKCDGPVEGQHAHSRG